MLLRGFLKIALVLAPLLIMSGFSRHVPARGAVQPRVRQLLFGWLMASVLGVVLFGGWFNHYALPVMAPGACCAAVSWGITGSAAGWRPPLLLLTAIGGQITILSAIWHRGNGSELRALAGAIGPGPGCLYVYSGNSILYAYTGRCAASPWMFPSHLSRTPRKRGAGGRAARRDRPHLRAPSPVSW
ncbi:MAG: hypothetical protein WDN44_06425 [Sphingomonas sp.]